MQIKILFFNFICEEFIKGIGDKLRGYFANKFGEYVLIHHHLNNKLLYKSPLIQYKILNGKPFVLGVNEGADILQRIHADIDYLKIGYKEYQIKEKKIVFKTDDFGSINNSNNYFFITPWLALNEENYRRYVAIDPRKKKQLLSKILIGNILSMSKGLGYTVTDELKADVNVREVTTRLKGVPMIGFMGKFSVNFEIPDYLGIGKSVSRGFGTVKKI